MNASMRVRAGCLLLLGWMLAGLAGAAWAQGGAPISPVPLDGGLSSWLTRLRRASSIPSFVGTYVVTSASGARTSARIWHACEGEVQLERIDVLNGPQRSSYRRNDVVSLLEPGARLIRVEQREAGGRFPNLLGPADDETIAANYRLNTLGRERVAGLDADIAFEPYAVNRTLGGFILVDRQSNATVACGMLDFALDRASNLHWQHMDIDKSVRARSKAQRPLCVWFTGLSGAGKSTIANLLERRLHALGYHTYLLDCDNVRHGLNRDLGFTPEARVENIRRVAEVAHLMVDAGLIVLVSAISPYGSERRWARSLFDVDEFVEVFVDTPLAECERRDPKGLYRKARAGDIRNFTGVDAPYEMPEAPDIHLPTSGQQAEALAEQVAKLLVSRLESVKPDET